MKEGIIQKLERMENRLESIEQRLKRKEPEEFLTTREACDYLKISRTKFNEMKNEGLLKVAKVKGRLIVKKSDLMALIESLMLDNSPKRA